MKSEILFSYIIFDCVNIVMNGVIAKSLLVHANFRQSTSDLISRDGYLSENHEIVTDDGYLINVQRIPGLRGSIPILINHGLCSDSHLWVLNGKNYSLPYILASEEFDVWLGNVRGNSYGKKHIKLSPRDPQFWKFSIDEIGIYDIPGMISYIHKLTNQQVVFIGYSLTATAGLIMNMKRHDMDSKIRCMIHLGPPIFMDSARISSNKLINLFNGAKPLLDLLKIYEWPPGDLVMNLLVKRSCRSNKIATKTCEEMVLFLFDSDHVHVSHSTLRGLMNYMPDTTSTMVMNHLAQWAIHGYFRPYDFGVLQNLKRYKRITPLDYDLSDIDVPTAIFYTDNDDYVSSEAILRLYNAFHSRTDLIRVESDRFSHLHFQLATNARDLVYKKILKIIHNFY